MEQAKGTSADAGDRELVAFGVVWTCAHGVVLGMLWLGLVDGIVGALRVALSVLWLGVSCEAVLFSRWVLADTDAERAEILRRMRVRPRRLARGFTYSVRSLTYGVLVWHGYFATAAAVLVSDLLFDDLADRARAVRAGNAEAAQREWRP